MVYDNFVIWIIQMIEARKLRVNTVFSGNRIVLKGVFAEALKACQCLYCWLYAEYVCGCHIVFVECYHLITENMLSFVSCPQAYEIFLWRFFYEQIQKNPARTLTVKNAKAQARQTAVSALRAKAPVLLTAKNAKAQVW